jgi:hypothetical protein
VYESICLSFFSGLLYLINDINSDVVFGFALISFLFAAVLGIIGRIFNLFIDEDLYSEFE